MIVNWNGKDWLRIGECNRCGECCNLGWVKPCPHHIQNADFTSSCRIHEKRGEKDDEEALAIAGVRTTKCPPFPADPGDLMNPYIRNRCSYQFVEAPRILVACPTFDGKEYSWERWIGGVRALTYANYGVLVVDNSIGTGFYERHKGECPMVRVELPDAMPPMERICRSMEVIRKHFLACTYQYWLNVEADNTVPPDVIQTMLDYGRGADWVAHAYPSRNQDQYGDPDVEGENGVGCSMFSRRLVDWVNFDEAGPDSPDSWLWDRVRRAKRFKTIEAWGYMRVGHLRE